MQSTWPYVEKLARICIQRFDLTIDLDLGKIDEANKVNLDWLKDEKEKENLTCALL